MKISLCTVCMNRAHHVKQTLKKNIIDNEDYADTEFIILDYNSKDDLEDYVRTNLTEYINSKKLTYYKCNTHQYFNRTHSRNIAFKMATGEIICNVDADNFTGKGFAAYLNELFTQNQHCFYYANDRSDVIGRIAVSRSSFYKIGGFDERMVYYGFEDSDFIHRLMKSGLKAGIINNKQYLAALSHSNKDRIANEYVVNNYYKILISFKTYSSSIIIILFKNNIFFEDILENRLNLNLDKPDLTSKSLQYDYGIQGNKWIKGTWSLLDTSLIFYYETNFIKTLIQNDEFNYKQKGENTLYQEVSNKVLIEEALFFYSQLTNRIVFENNLASKSYKVNNNGFGKDVVYKNFNSEPINI